MLISSVRLIGTTAAGTFSVNTPNIRGICYQIIIKPETETTVYNISIVNSANAKVYERTSETGTLSEFLTFPMAGVYTLTIDNSTQDEDFIIQILYEG